MSGLKIFTFSHNSQTNFNRTTKLSMRQANLLTMCTMLRTRSDKLTRASSKRLNWCRRLAQRIKDVSLSWGSLSKTRRQSSNTETCLSRQRLRCQLSVRTNQSSGSMQRSALKLATNKNLLQNCSQKTFRCSLTTTRESTQTSKLSLKGKPPRWGRTPPSVPSSWV